MRKLSPLYWRLSSERPASGTFSEFRTISWQDCPRLAVLSQRHTPPPSGRRALQTTASATPSTRAIRPARLPPARAPLATQRVSIGNWNTSLPSSELAELFSAVRLRHCRGMRFSYDANRRQRQRFRICWNAGKCNHPCVFHRVSQNPDSTFSILTLARPPIARERQPSHRRVLCKVRLDLSSHDRTPIIPSTCRCKAHLSLPSHNDASHPIGTPFARRIATSHRAVER